MDDKNEMALNIMLAMFMAKSQDALQHLGELAELMEMVEAPEAVTKHISIAMQEVALVGLSISEVLLKDLGQTDFDTVFRDVRLTGRMN